MSELLLRSTRSLTGARTVTATLRPLRLAYLVDPTDPGSAMAAIDACCLLWSGPQQMLIPCVPDGEPDPFWITFMDRHDPDLLIDLVGAAPSFLERQKNLRQRLTSYWTHPTETMQLHGALLPSILQRQMSHGQWKSTYPILNLHPLFNHPFALPLAYRIGHLERRPMDHRDLRRKAYVEHRIEDVAQLNVIDPTSIPSDVLVQLITEYPLPVSTPEQPGYIGAPSFRLIDAASIFVAGMSWTSPNISPSDDEFKYGDPLSHQLIIVGRPDSVADLCLAWNLRAFRPVGPEPIWISREWLADPVVLERLEASRLKNQDNESGSRHPGEEWLGFVSASLADEELSQLAGAVQHAVVHRSDMLARLLPDQVKVGVSQRSTAIFVDGRADVALPDISELGKFGEFESIAVTVSIPHWQLPRMPKPEYGSFGGIVRVARDGLVGELRNVGRSDHDLVTVNARNGKDAVDAVALAAGFAAKVSDKGKLAIAVLERFGSLQELSMLASSRVYGLLNEMATGIVSRQAVQSALRRHAPNLDEAATIDSMRFTLEQGLLSDGQFDRQHFTGNQIHNQLKVSKDDANWVLSFLVERGIIFRGFEVQCQNCGLRRWQVIDRMAASYTCDGCLTTMPTPLTSNDVLQWRYRLNELVAHAVDQGVLPHLLGVHHLANQYWGRDSPLLGFLPGVDFVAQDQDEGIESQSGEADFVGIIGGHVLLAECKRNGSELSAVDVEKTIWLAEHFESPMVVFATPTDFSQATAAMVALDKRDNNPAIEMWVGSDLLDPRHDPAAPQIDPVEYLSSTVAWLRSRSVTQ